MFQGGSIIDFLEKIHALRFLQKIVTIFGFIEIFGRVSRNYRICDYLFNKIVYCGTVFIDIILHNEKTLSIGAIRKSDMFIFF